MPSVRTTAPISGSTYLTVRRGFKPRQISIAYYLISQPAQILGGLTAPCILFLLDNGGVQSPLVEADVDGVAGFHLGALGDGLAVRAGDHAVAAFQDS
jgi:hypothetical protein